MSVDTEALNRMSYQVLRAWLTAALGGRVALPRLGPDEPVHLGILRIEGELDKPTRRDLAKACQELVYELARTAGGDPDWIDALLQVAVGLGLESVAPALIRLAEAFPTSPTTSGSTKRKILAALVDLGTPPPVPFWKALLEQNPRDFAAPAISALLRVAPAIAVEVLPSLPDEQSVADATTILVEQAADRLDDRERARLVERVRRVVAACSPTMRTSLSEWLASRGEVPAPDARRDYSVIDEALKLIDQHFKPQPTSARLCPT